jgi:hypothetical protein
MMRKVHFYNERTGEIMRNASLAGTAKNINRLVAANTPAGFRPIEGVTDPESQRVDVQTGAVVDFQPPLKRPGVERAEIARAEALTRIGELEGKQFRIEREMKLRPNEVGSDGKTPMQRYEELDAEIAKQRGIVNGETDANGR